jgi:hypothetical protein
MSTNSWQPAATKVASNKDPLEFLKNAHAMPAHIEPNINGLQWARALFYGERYTEPRPGYMSAVGLANMMDAEDLYAANEGSNYTSLSDMCPDVEGATTGDIIAHDIYVLPSNKTTGPTTYVVIQAQHCESGASITFTANSKAIQGFYLKALVRGIWPVKHQIVRSGEVTGEGKHIYVIAPPSQA